MPTTRTATPETDWATVAVTPEVVDVMRHRPLGHLVTPVVEVGFTPLHPPCVGEPAMVVVSALGFTPDGAEEPLGLEMGCVDDWTFWLSFFESLHARGLRGVRVAVVAEDFEGVGEALGAVYPGAIAARPEEVVAAWATLPVGG